MAPHGDVVFTTCHDDYEDGSGSGTRSGAFDYLVKPGSARRLGQTLTRYQQRRHVLASVDSASQKQMNEMFAPMRAANRGFADGY